MPYRWEFHPLPPQFQPELAQAVGKYAAKILALRGYTSLEQARSFLFAEEYQPSPAWRLPDMDRAVDRILLAQQRQERVWIWGDFDCDGVTSTALLWSALKPLGLDLRFTIPLRSGEGHGLNPKRLQQVADQGADLIITVDCGVANHAEIQLAQTFGLDVIVTDHHLLPDPLPRAAAVVNPLRLDEADPLRFLTGVGVAYKLVEAIYERVQWPEPEAFLDLVVVGLVADVAVLQRECRYLVQRGLPILAGTERLGLKALIDQQLGGESRLKLLEGGARQTLSAEDVGFRIAPKLNAIGRLDDASLAVELLTTHDPVRAQALVDLFVATNLERRELTEQVVNQASQQVESFDLQQNRAIVLASAEWNQGVVGIAASRLVDRYNCPTVLIACWPETGEGYGSGRSIASVNLVEAMDAVKPLLSSYGGHPMAAGLRVSLDQVDALRLALSQELAARVSHAVQDPELSIEIALDCSQIPDPAAELDQVFQQLQQLQPFGHGNPRPVIALLNFRPSRFNPDLSRSGEHLQFKLKSRRLWFWGEGSRHRDLTQMPGIDIAFVMEATNSDRSRRQQPSAWQGKVKDVRLAGERPFQPTPNLDLHVQDYRHTPIHPLAGAVYTGELPDPADELLLLHWPYLPVDLAQILHHVKPRRVFLVGQRQDFRQVNEWIAQIVQAWQTSDHQPQELIQQIGPDLPEIWIHWILASPQVDQADQGIGIAAVELFHEIQAFQQWLDQADIREIAKLCKRLMVLDPAQIKLAPRSQSYRL